MEEGIKENSGWGNYSSMIYLVYCKNFCKYHNVSKHNNKKLNKERKKKESTFFGKLP
jgi:hypothetical protein